MRLEILIVLEMADTHFQEPAILDQHLEPLNFAGFLFANFALLPHELDPEVVVAGSQEGQQETDYFAVEVQGEGP